MGENGGRELVGEDLNILGRVKVGTKIEIRQVNRAKESVVGDNRIKEDVDGRKRSDLCGGGQEEGRLSPPAVPRTRRSTPVV